MKAMTMKTKKLSKRKKNEEIDTPSLLGGDAFPARSGLGLYPEPKFKTLDGKVLGNGATPLPGAIVYLQDSKTTTSAAL